MDITSGYITTTGEVVGNGGSYDLIGNGFSVTGNWGGSFFNPGVCGPCTAGSSLGANGGTGPFGADLAPATFTINGVTQTLFVGDEAMTSTVSGFAVTGAPITVTGAGTYEEPFTMTGLFCGTTDATASTSCAVSMPITGSGMAMITLEPFTGPAGQPLYMETTASYQFTDPIEKAATVPEPATWGLMALGLVLIALLSRQRAASSWRASAESRSALEASKRRYPAMSVDSLGSS